METMEIKKKGFGKQQITDLIPYFGVIFVFALFGILTKGKLFAVSSLLNLVNNGLAMLICSVAAVPVFARGDLDFSLGGIEGLCILLAGYVIQENINNAWLGLVICIAVGCLVGIINGFVVNVLSIPSFVVTIAMNYILRGLIYTLVSFKEVSYPVEFAKTYSVYVCLAILIIVSIVTYILMEKTRVGKIDKLHGENANAVRFSGIKDNLYGIISFAFLGTVTGICAFLVAPRFTLVQANVGETLAIDVLIACMIGGLSMSGGMGAKVSRPLIGSLIIAVLNQGYALLNVQSSVSQVTKGLIFIVILAITSPSIAKLFAKLKKNKGNH